MEKKIATLVKLRRLKREFDAGQGAACEYRIVGARRGSLAWLHEARHQQQSKHPWLKWWFDNPHWQLWGGAALFFLTNRPDFALGWYWSLLLTDFLLETDAFWWSVLEWWKQN